jgi:hypothetical protein
MSVMADTLSGGGTITTLLTRSCMGRQFDTHHPQAIYIFTLSFNTFLSFL